MAKWIYMSKVFRIFLLFLFIVFVFACLLVSLSMSKYGTNNQCWFPMFYFQVVKHAPMIGTDTFNVGFASL